MTLVVKVDGGTNAGHKPPVKAPKPWLCSCGHDNPAYASTCLACDERRPRG